MFAWEDALINVVLHWALFEVAPNTKAQNKINSINLFTRIFFFFFFFYEDL